MPFARRILLGLALACTANGADWRAGDGFRFSPLNVPTNGRPGFTALLESQTGIAFTNHLADRSVAENQIRLIGSGVALGDVDGDGLSDIYLCRLEGNNALYRNLGNWKFTDITASAGVACTNQLSTGATFADLDGDGDLDLLVNSMGGGTRCFFNNGQARFTERNSGLLQKFCATSLALGDIDGNATLDFYVANYRTTTIRSTGLQVLNVNGRRMLRPEDRDGYEIIPEGLILEHAEPDALYLNDGQGNFTLAPWNRFTGHDGQPLARGDRDWGLSVMMRDMNGDGAPDIYVCNDFWSHDAIWINTGQGHFRALNTLALRTTSTFSMGVDFADINRDGLDDFVVLDMRSREHVRRMTQRAMLGGAPTLARIDERLQTERNTLFLNRGDGTYAEIAQLAGVHASEWSWSAAFMDVDLDGFEDLLVTTGHGFDSQDVDTEDMLARNPRGPGEKIGDRILRFPRLHVPNQAFRNNRDLTFSPAGEQWGFHYNGVSHGMALGDLDGDGDLDAVVNNLNSPVSIYRNDAPYPRIAVQLKDKTNAQGIGARIKLIGGVVTQAQEVVSGGRYLSGDVAERVFAAWHATNRFTLEVHWRSGVVTVVSNVLANSRVELNEAAATPRPPDAQRAPRPLFKDASATLGHVHRDEPYDDFARQPLLSRRLSHGGPGVTIADVDGDGRDDLLIPSGRGGELALFRNTDGTFKRTGFAPVAREDQTAAIAWPGTILLGQANYDSPLADAPAALRFTAQGERIVAGEPLENRASGTGPIVVADVDADGDLDAFVGGQYLAGRYPEAASSCWYRNTNGAFVLAQEWPGLGLVNGAVFTDLNGDGYPELALACEWGPLRILRNERGTFTTWNSPLSGSSHPQLATLSDMHGWWQGVTAADFDGDGRMDLAASNWGRNSPYQPFVRDGLRFYYGDLSGAGHLDGIEAYVSNGKVVPWRDLESLSRALPSLRQRFPTHHAFARASIEEVLGERLREAKVLRANWLESTVFLNRGERFEVRTLPIEAQFAPAFGLAAADFDGDGDQDLFLAQNFFETEGETSRYDAGRGLLLLGKGNGEFTATSAEESGIATHGAQRGAATVDFDADGRVDLVVGQNRAETKLWRNQTARPGVRVRLRGPAGNPQAIGAVIRDGNGPAREIHGGSGYWSQSSAVVIVSGEVKELSIRWPVGKSTVTKLPASAREVLIDAEGKLLSSTPR